MAPKKQQAKAPDAKVPLNNPRKRNSKKAGKPTRAEKKELNKAEYAVTAKALRAEIVDQRMAEAHRILGHAKCIDGSNEYTDELGDVLEELIATGHSMDSISRLPGMPSIYFILKWVSNNTHPFAARYARAKQMLVTLYEERALLAAVQPETFTIITKRQALNKDGDIADLVEERIVDNTARSALKMQGYQWTLSHLKPKKHGRNPDQGVDGPNAQLEGLFAALKAGPAE